MIFNDFFKDKTILVTGHTGFIGSWLTLWLTLLGANVIGFSLNCPTNPSLFKILNLENKIQHYFGDINDTVQLKKVILKHNPEIIFHLAAQSLVRLSYETPIETLQTNIIGTANLLEIIRDLDVKICIIMTSDKCYKNSESLHAYEEDDPLGGIDPYSASKGATEIIVTSYQQSFFNNPITQKTKIATIRSGNVIGGGDWAIDRLIPDCTRSFSNNESIDLRNPLAVRPFQYVLEPISGMFNLAVKMWSSNLFSEPWNIGPLLSNKSSTVKDVVNKIIEYWGGGSWKDISRKKSVHEAKLLILNPQKAIDKLDWHPVYDLEQSIKETVTWYKKFNEKKDMIKFSEYCISTYTKKAIEMKLKWISPT